MGVKNNLAEKNQARNISRQIVRGASMIMGSVPKALAMITLLALMVVVWTMRPATPCPIRFLQVALRSAENVAAAMVAIMIFLVVCFFKGGGLNSLRMQENLQRIGFCNSVGEAPYLISSELVDRKRGVYAWTFSTIGMDITQWTDRLLELQSALNVTIASVGYGDDLRTIKMLVAPPSTKLPKKLRWWPECLPDGEMRVALGQSVLGPVIADFAAIPHALIAGSTGSGKSVLLNSILWQMWQKETKINIIDLKGGIDYSPYWPQKGAVLATNCEGALELLETISIERQRREKLLLDYGCRNIAEYNDIANGETMRHIVVAVDEASMLLDAHLKDKAAKDTVLRITDLVTEIARMGRATGIHLILATQRPDADAIPGSIKSLIDYRICGRADATLSTIVLGDGKAHGMIPKDDPGLFVINDDAASAGATLFRGYWVDFTKEGGARYGG